LIFRLKIAAKDPYILVMKQIALTATLAFALALPAQADDTKPEEGFGLMEKGARLLFEGLLQEMQPAGRCAIWKVSQSSLNRLCVAS